MISNLLIDQADSKGVLKNTLIIFKENIDVNFSEQKIKARLFRREGRAEQLFASNLSVLFSSKHDFGCIVFADKT